MVAGFTTTYAISASGEFESHLWQGVLDTTLCDKFVSDLRQVGGFLRFPPSIKLTHDIIKILLKVALSTITLILYHK